MGGFSVTQGGLGWQSPLVSEARNRKETESGLGEGGGKHTG